MAFVGYAAAGVLIIVSTTAATDRNGIVLRIFPTSLLRAIRWEELRHPFFLETIIKPLRLGVRAVEVPGAWATRTEGESQNSFLRNFEYFRIALRVRFAPPERCLEGAAQGSRG